ncbi:MAG: SDR family NAD(P)-dependent oxidoreductase [Myxococcota bacterium]
MGLLEGKVALVTGASRGVGRGIALGLGEAGARVDRTGRTLRDADSELPGSLESTAEAVAKLGGEPRMIRCDHARDEQVEAVFHTVSEESGRIDVLVHSAWGGYERMVEEGRFAWSEPFWKQPLWRWDAMFRAASTLAT